jgi:hypothetical protein
MIIRADCSAGIITNGAIREAPLSISKALRGQSEAIVNRYHMLSSSKQAGLPA